eukprot:Sro2230_g319980.3  (197) ;mRNA; f:2301-2891
MFRHSSSLSRLFFFLLAAVASATNSMSHNAANSPSSPNGPSLDYMYRPITTSEIPMACFNEHYELNLVVFQERLFFAALPLATSSCPPIVTLAGFRHTDHATYLGTIVGVELVRSTGTFIGFQDLHSLRIAYTNALATTHPVMHGQLTEEGNCTIFVFSLLHHLGYEVTREIAELVVMALLPEAHTLMIARAHQQHD